MRNQEYLLNHMTGIFHTGIFCLCEEKVDFYEDSPEHNPIYNSHELRLALCDGADGQEELIMIKDDFHMVYIGIKSDSAYYMMGPLSVQFMSRVERRRFYHFYGGDEKWEKGLHYHTAVTSEAGGSAAF